MARLHALPTLEIPPAEHTVTAPADQHRAGRTPRQRVPDVGQFAQRVQELSTVRIPDEELSTASASATTSQVRPIRAPCHAHDHATMPLQAGLLFAVGGLPQDNAAIVAATGQARSIWTPRHPTDRGWLPTAHPPAGARPPFPPPPPPPIAPPRPTPALPGPPHARERGIRLAWFPPSLRHPLLCHRP